MSTKKVMRLDPSPGLMECTICGRRHCASIKPDSGGHHYPGSWQCLNGCKPESPRNPNGPVFGA